MPGGGPPPGPGPGPPMCIMPGGGPGKEDAGPPPGGPEKAGGGPPMPCRCPVGGEAMVQGVREVALGLPDREEATRPEEEIAAMHCGA